MFIAEIALEYVLEGELIQFRTHDFLWNVEFWVETDRHWQNLIVTILQKIFVLYVKVSHLVTVTIDSLHEEIFGFIASPDDNLPTLISIGTRFISPLAYRSAKYSIPSYRCETTINLLYFGL